MDKIQTLFERDWEGDRSRVLDQVVPGCEWVLEGEGVATRKYDGTCVMLDADGRWWARREVKADKEPPDEFVPTSHDHKTLKTIGWEPIERSGFAKWHADALSQLPEPLTHLPGTFELCGPKVQGNPEHLDVHTLIAHEFADAFEVERSFDGIRSYLAENDVEGIVFHHEDGRMAKINGRDFGLRRP